MSELRVNEAAAFLAGLDRVLILTHIRPDGDTVGCAAALCAGLRQLGKTAFLLPNPELTDNTRPYFEPYAAPDGFEPGAVVSVDVADVSLLPGNAGPYLSRVDLAVDHHGSHRPFAARRIVRPDCAACGELIYDILRELTEITPEIALPLYVAVSTDTGGFIYANTTADTHRVAAALMETGIDYRTVNRDFFQTKSRRRMQLEAAMLTDAEYFNGGRTVLLTVPLSLMARLEATESDAEDLSALGPTIEGVTCAVTARELKTGVWKFSVRTKDSTDSSSICARLGGGGHPGAAGCTVEADWPEARRRILDSVAQETGGFAF